MKKIHCSNCGQLVDESANYCWSCGAAMHGEASGQFRVQAAPTDPAQANQSAHLEDPKLQVLIAEEFPPRLLAPAAQLLFFINYIGITSLILVVLAVTAYFEPIVAAIGFGIYVILTYLIAMVVYNHFYFSVESEGLRIEYGIINKRHVTIPFQQIQNVNITRTLIDRILGIGKLEIESAGSTFPDKREVVGGTRSKAEGFLPGLTMKEAEHLHDLLLQKSLHEKSRR
ncbi:MAG TPA: PH domain-containing protein [Candidatus Saccharimonadales bacterium]|nr:PH domain-containing protein [Candidatus Saccharimonadales bacterium]